MGQPGGHARSLERHTQDPAPDGCVGMSRHDRELRCGRLLGFKGQAAQLTGPPLLICLSRNLHVHRLTLFFVRGNNFNKAQLELPVADKVFTLTEFYDARPVLSLGERVEGFEFLPRDQVDDFFLQLSPRDRAHLVLARPPGERIGGIGVRHNILYNLSARTHGSGHAICEDF